MNRNILKIYTLIFLQLQSIQFWSLIMEIIKLNTKDSENKENLKNNNEKSEPTVSEVNKSLKEEIPMKSRRSKKSSIV